MIRLRYFMMIVLAIAGMQCIASCAGGDTGSRPQQRYYGGGGGGYTGVGP